MKTKRVRIALAMDEEGAWVASGCSRSSDDDSVSISLDILDSGGLTGINFIEADVPLPEPVTVEGRVVE